jgi:hypothetical protein
MSYVEGEKTGDGISYASHVKNPNPLKARATTFYDPVHNALDKESQCAWEEGEGSYWPSVYILSPSTMSYNMMIGYDIYHCFTMEHFRLRQRMTLTTKIIARDCRYV